MPRAKSVYEELNIRVLPLQEEIKVEMCKNGIISVKNISLDDLINSLSSSRKESKVIKSGFLPENCLSITIEDKRKELVLWHPLLRVDYTYFKTMYENFPIPRMVFGISINPEGKISNCRMAVVADEKPRPDTKLYEFPFSNVYSDSRICIGAANELPVYKNLHSLASLPNHILSIPNNDHNFDRSHNRLNLGYRELLDHMQDKDPAYYYDRVLVPNRNGKTLQDFIDKKLGGIYEQ